MDISIEIKQDMIHIVDELTQKDDRGNRVIEPFISQGDHISDIDIGLICNSNTPFNTLEEVVSDMYYDEYASELRSIVLEVSERLSEEYGIDMDEEIVEEYVYKNVLFSPPVHEFDRQPVKVDIFIDTGDSEDYFQANTEFFNYGSHADEASIVKLAEWQGYTEEDLLNEFKNEDKLHPGNFLESVNAEFCNVGSHMQDVVILAEMPLKELIELSERMNDACINGMYAEHLEDRPDCGTVTVGKDATVGLFNMLDGGGGPMEIKLEKDFKLPINCIEHAEPDKAVGPWNFEKAYGLTGSQWKEDVIQINDDEPGLSKLHGMQENVQPSEQNKEAVEQDVSR